MSSVETDRMVREIGAEMGALVVRAPLEPTEDFFACGGDSLRAVELIDWLTDRCRPEGGEAAARLRAALLMAAFDDATPRSMAAVVQQDAG